MGLLVRVYHPKIMQKLIFDLPKLVSARAESKMAWLIFIFVSVGAPSSPKFGYWINPFLVLLSIPNQLEYIIFIWRMDYDKR